MCLLELQKTDAKDKRQMKKKKRTLVERLKGFVDKNLTDKKTIYGVKKRFGDAVYPEMEYQDRLQARAHSRAVSKVVR